MKRLKIMKSYVVLWLFIYFLIYSNIDHILVFFMATLTFNLAVLTVLTIGIIMVMKAAINLVMLAGTFGILAYKKDNLNFYLRDIDKIMPANIAHMFHARAEKGMLLFTTEESRDVIDWIEEKFSHQNRYTNYFTGTVLMIGLLGTFSGLLIAIDDMGRIILSLSGDIDLAKVISDFSGPLGGMAVGFGSSLFGVIAAIILGLKGYILNKNQEILVEGVEDWLKGRIIDSGGATTANVGMGGANEMPDHKASFMDVFIENLSSLSTEMSKISRTNEQLTSITVASVQQARDEHELSIDLFQDISDTLKKIDVNSNNTTNILGQQFNSLQISMNTNHAQLLEQHQNSIKSIIEKLESALEITHTQITQKFQTISENTSAEMKERVGEIGQLLSAIDMQLKEKQKLLTQIKNSGDESSEKNENLLKQLVSLFEESSTKLDSEQEILDSIYKQLDTSSEVSKTHFSSISEAIKEFSKTLQSELTTLDSLQEIQKNQSEMMQTNVSKSQEIHNTLLESQEQGAKQEHQLSTIVSKIDEVTTKMSESTSQSLNLSQNQDDILEKLLDASKQNAHVQQENIANISLKIDGVKDEFLNSSQKQEASISELKELNENEITYIKDNNKNQKENLENISVKIDNVKDEVVSTGQKQEESISELKELNENEISQIKDNTQEVISKIDSIEIEDNKEKSSGFFGKFFK